MHVPSFPFLIYDLERLSFYLFNFIQIYLGYINMNN